jgi:ABC-type Fe3+ transport system permease subunit
MDKSVHPIAPWRPKTSKVAWICAAIPVVFGLLPFLTVLTMLTLRDLATHSSINLTEWLRVTKLTVAQAFISSLMVCIIAPALALATCILPATLRRVSLSFRTLLYTLPATVMATGFILAWGKSGQFTVMLTKLGLDPQIWTWLYTSWGLILVNVAMNAPFASVLLYRAVASIPNHLWDSAQLMGLKTTTLIRAICWPAMRSTLQLIALVTFSISMGTFGAVAILGGGPSSQTLEMSTYIALFTFADWSHAAIFSATHAVINAVVVITVLITQRRSLIQHTTDGQTANRLKHQPIRIPIRRSGSSALMLIITCILFDLALATPIAAITIDAALELMKREISSDVVFFIMQAVQTSLQFAVPVALLTSLSCWLLTRGYFSNIRESSAKETKLLLTMPMLGAIVPGMALGFGYWAINSFLDLQVTPDFLLIPILITLTMPFIMPTISPYFARHVYPYIDFQRLNGITSSRWLLQVEGPAMLGPFMTATTLALILTINETSVVSLLRPPENPALSTALMVLMGRYKFGEAAIGATLLLFINFIFIAIISRSKEATHD